MAECAISACQGSLPTGLDSSPRSRVAGTVFMVLPPFPALHKRHAGVSPNTQIPRKFPLIAFNLRQSEALASFPDRTSTRASKPTARRFLLFNDARSPGELQVSRRDPR